MPRVKKRPKKRKSGYDEHHIRQLRWGHAYLPGLGFPDNQAMYEAWQIFRDALLADWIREDPRDHRGGGPGTRPWAWWTFDAPELRRRIDGRVHPFSNPDRTAHVERIAAEHPQFKAAAMKLYFGMPGSLCIPDDFGAEYESEQAYIERLDLWLPGEREMLL